MRLTYSIGVNSTETFRFTAGKSPKRKGFNVHTTPHYFRSAFDAPPGRIFGNFDLSQAEVRFVARRAKVKYLNKLFVEGKSIHKEFGKKRLGYEPKKGTSEYNLCKSTVHAYDYREMPSRFSLQTGTPLREAKAILRDYGMLVPEIHEWHHWVWEQIRTKGYLVNPFEFKRVFYEALACFSITKKMTDQQWKDAISWEPQSTIPVVTNIGMTHVRDKMKENVFTHLQHHDSFLDSVVPEALPELFGHAMDGLKVEIPFQDGPLVIPVEAQAGYSWGWMMPLESPRVVCYDEWYSWKSEEETKCQLEERVLADVYGPLLKKMEEKCLI